MSNRTGRSASAVSAQFRTSAGSMRDKRTPRGGSHNEERELLNDYMEDNSPPTDSERYVACLAMFSHREE